MTMEKRTLERVLEAVLSAHGFRAQKRTWYAASDEATKVVDLQKSQYGEQYFINLAVCLKQLGGPEKPKEHQCHVRARLTSLLADPAPLDKALDLEDATLSDEAREREIIGAMSQFGLPFFDEAGSLDGLRHLDARGTLDKFFVNRQVRELLQASPEEQA